MNYAELVEKARETYESEDTPHVVKAWLLANIIYPADESEDEKVRKALIELVKYAKGNCLELLNKPFNVVSMDAMLAWLEKQEENKPTDKVKSKFHEGEWITNGDYTWKIVEVKSLDYILQSQDGNIVDDNISYVDKQFHLWTINDANDGDVLVCPSDLGDRLVVFIFKQLVNHTSEIDCHCCIDANGIFDPCLNDCCYVGDADDADYIPATKEQRYQLFQKMTESGYEWDNEKKELKKTEVSSKEKEDERIRKALIENFIFFGGDYLETSKWGKDDDLLVTDILAWLEKQGKKLNADEVIEWLKPYAIADDIIDIFKKDFKL